MNAFWLIDMYHKCAKLESQLDKEITEMFELEMYDGAIFVEFIEGYNYLLQGAVGVLGGHMGHYKFLSEQTNIPWKFLFGGEMDRDSFIKEIKGIIEEEEVEEGDELISAYDAVGLVWNILFEFKNAMSEKLKVFTGSKEPVPYYRCDLIMAELYVYLEED